MPKKKETKPQSAKKLKTLNFNLDGEKSKEDISKDKEIDKGLKSIYQDNEGKLPNLSKLEFKKKNKIINLVILIIVVLFVIFVVSFLGLLVFQPEAKFSEEKVNLEIKAPFSAISGAKINYQIKIGNQGETNLTKTQLIVYLPYGFIWENSSLPPQVNQGNENIATFSNIKTWQINDINSQRENTLEINGRLIGDLNSKQTISALLSYVPANFNSEFQKKSSFDTAINDSLVNIEEEHASQVANQEETEFKLKISNKSEEFALNDLEIDLNYPPEFTLTASQLPDEKPKTPAASEASPKIWQIKNLLPKEQKEIDFKGKFDVTESKTAEFDVQIKLKGPTDNYFLQKEDKLDLEVIKGELLANLFIQGSNQNKPINLGDTLNYLISIQNKSQKTLGDLKIRAVLDSPFLDWSSLNDKNKGVNEDNQILWTKDQIPKLAFLLPEDELEINFQIKLKPYQESKSLQPEDYQVKSFFETQVNKVDNKEAEITNQSNAIINELNTNLVLNAQVRYFGDNNSTVGAGPLPPIVSQKTSYKVFLTLTNSLHEIQAIEVKAKLPDYVSFEGQENSSTGDIFKNQQNEIVWQISRIPDSVEKSTAEFEISITPAAKDVHKILTLISEINLTAIDTQTQGLITQTLQGQTTNLDFDPLGKGKGLVQEE